MEHTLAANWAWGKGTCAPTRPITTNVSPTRGIWPLVIKRYHHTSKHRLAQHGVELKSLSGWLIYERRCKARLNGQPIPARANSAGFVAVQMAPSRESESGTTQQPTIRIEYASAEVTLPTEVALRQQAQIAAQNIAVRNAARDGQCRIEPTPNRLQGLQIMAHQRKTSDRGEVVVELLDDELAHAEVLKEYRFDTARSACLDLLATVRNALGTLDKVAQVLEVHGSLNTTPEFEDHARVLDGASDLLVEVFGSAGIHVRSVIGVASLRNGVPLTVRATIRCVPE